MNDTLCCDLFLAILYDLRDLKYQLTLYDMTIGGSYGVRSVVVLERFKFTFYLICFIR